MCLDNYIGIRGECSEAKLYLDDLPGININNAADVVDGLDIRPLDLVKKAWRMAIDQVYSDWINSIAGFTYLGIVSDSEYKFAGTYEYYGEIDQDIRIKVKRLSRYHKFVNTKIYSFGLVSDRITTQIFSVKDEYGTEIKSIEKELVAGYNDIEIDIVTSSIEVTISFSLLDFKVGRMESTFGLYGYNDEIGCSPCFESGCTDCTLLFLEKSSDNFVTKESISDLGLNLKVKCIADKCTIVEHFIETLKVPLLFKTGINYYTEVKMTGRINPYTLNAKDKVDELLLLWQGGTDAVTGIKTNSAYWQSLKVAANSSDATLRNMKSMVFSYSGNEIVNMLP